MNERLKLSIIVMALCVGGCQQDKDDLAAYVAGVKAQQKSDIPPIPVMKPYEQFDYAAADLRDPFVPTVIDVPEPESVSVDGNGIRPDENRRREALEFFELSELQYVGTLEKEQIWALVRSPDGVIHRVQIGNYMGRNHGRILAITDTTMTLKEIVPSGRGGFTERDTSVSAIEVK